MKTNYEMLTEAEALLQRITGLVSPENRKDPIVRAKIENLLEVLEDLGETMEEN